ncbi:MAG: dUTP diphosphatase [Clostridiales bacterium]|jgi:dUTP pyrophosphatase|nr:dUTP diphosphatase [Clostridiales bacterium]
MDLYIKKLRKNAVMPSRETSGSAGFDISACIDEPIEIKPNEIVKIPIGIAVKPSEENVALLVFPRSGLASKHGITLANSVGVVDSDYRGEISVPLINLGNKPFIVEPQMRIAQIVITPVIIPEIIEADFFDETERGDKGFGSTGLY